MFRNSTLSPILSMSDKWSFYSCVLDQARCFVKRNTYIIASSRVFQSTWSEKVPSHYHCWRKFTRTGNIVITFPRFIFFANSLVSWQFVINCSFLKNKLTFLGQKRRWVCTKSTSTYHFFPQCFHCNINGWSLSLHWFLFFGFFFFFHLFLETLRRSDTIDIELPACIGKVNCCRVVIVWHR